MQERSGVASVGCVVVDLAKIIDAYPAPNRLAMIEAVSLSTGGPGLNMAVNLSQLGAGFPNQIFGAIGDDAHGAYIESECSRLGIDQRGLRRLPGTATSFTDVFLERDSGRRTMFYHPGSNDLFDAASVDVESIGARILHAGSPGTMELLDQPVAAGGNGWSELLGRAQAVGTHTNMELVDLSPGRMVELVSPCLTRLNSLVINELEAGMLTGIAAPTPDADGEVNWGAIEAMAVRLVQMGVSTLAVVHFPAGAVAAAPGGMVWRQGSVLVPSEGVRSAVGAGDAFAAGVLFGLHQAWPIEDLLRLGVASAAACIREAHTSEGIKPADDCLAAADQLGYRSTTG